MTANVAGRRLVFDVGLHSGDDSACYLSLGHRVVGIEANPLLAERGKVRFAEQISQGLMTVLNVGVLNQPGVFTFYRNITNDGWSSFDPTRGKKGKWEEIEVPCVTTRQLFAEHGKPYFIKIDIEGADLQAIESLTAGDCPDYISVELTARDPVVEKLIELGYTAFKFVDGETCRATTPIFDHEIGWRLLRKAGAILPPVKKAIASLPEHLRPKSEWNPPGKYSPDGYTFARSSSGPFGEAAAGRWMPPVEALSWFSKLCRNYREAGAEASLWWDVHARHGSTRV